MDLAKEPAERLARLVKNDVVELDTIPIGQRTAVNAILNPEPLENEMVVEEPKPKPKKKAKKK